MIVKCSTCSASNRLPAKRLKDKAHCAACKSPLLPIARPVVVTSVEAFDELVRETTGPLLVDFWAAWCGPCRMLGPELEKIATKRSGDLVIAKVDTEALPEIAQRFGIRTIPTMILFTGGKEQKRLSGAMPAAAIEERLPLSSVPTSPAWGSPAT